MTRILYAMLGLAFFFQTNAQTIDATLIEKGFLGSSNPDNLILVGNKLYFSAEDYRGRELWVHDRITGTTSLVKEIYPGYNNGIDYFYSSFAAIGDILYFNAASSFSSFGLWRTDGTEAGTWLVKNINPTADSKILGLTAFNGKLIFSANDGVNGQELWVSDGTASGTQLLADLRTGSINSNPVGFFEFNNAIYFSATTVGGKMWKTDGTTAGTQLVANCSPAFSNDTKPIVFNNAFYFYAYTSAFASELWKSDGTTTGTAMVKDIYPGMTSSADKLIGSATSDYILFVAQSPGTNGLKLWKTDGTDAGTVLVKDINPVDSVIDYFDQGFVTFHDKVYFGATDGTHGIQLWKSDGTDAGTQRVSNFDLGSSPVSYICRLTATENYLIFSAYDTGDNYLTPYVSDGTTAGTTQLLDINLGTGGMPESQYYFAVGNEVYFQAGFNETVLEDAELWITDGTTAGTHLVKDVNHAGNAMGSFSGESGWNAVVHNKSISFTGEPWVSDGTDEGTYLLKDLYPGPEPSIFSDSSDLTTSYPPMATTVGDKVFFRARTLGTGYELCVSDGTSDGTHLVKNIGAAEQDGINNFPLFMSYNDILYFKADDQVNGTELWRSDGTESGTYLLKDINPGAGSSLTQNNTHQYDSAPQYAIMNGLLYFRANDGTNASIWKTDGTPEGTQIAFTPPSAGNYDKQQTVLNAHNGKIYFSSNSTNDTSGNNTLWASDGTLAGTQQLGFYFINERQFDQNVIFNNEFYYSVYTANRLTIMKTDGTPGGTVVVKTAFTDTDNNRCKYMKVCGDYIYFSVGHDLYMADELWRTDGTTEGTIKISADSESGLSEYTCIENELLYLTNIGRDLIITDGTPENTETLNVHVVNGDQFGGNSVQHLTQLGDYINGKLLAKGYTYLVGTELYTLNVAPLLGINTPGDTIKSKQTVLAYPNPTQGKITLKTSNGDAIHEVTVCDISGRQIFKKAMGADSETLTLDGLTSGIYLLRIKTATATETKKIILK